MSRHVFVLAAKAIGLAGSINCIGTIRLPKVGIEAVLVASMGWTISEEDGGRKRTSEDTSTRAIITVEIVGTVDNTNSRVDITVKSWVGWATCNASPS